MREIIYSPTTITKLEPYDPEGQNLAELAFYLCHGTRPFMRRHAPRLHTFGVRPNGITWLEFDRLDIEPTPFDGQPWNPEQLTQLRKVVRQARALGAHDIGVVEDDAYNVGFATNLRNRVNGVYVYDFGRISASPKELPWGLPLLIRRGISWKLTEEGEIEPL